MFPASFAKHDLYNLPEQERSAAATSLGLPYVDACLESITHLQAAGAGGAIRRYLLDLLTEGHFVIRSPVTGRTVQSGASLLLVDKSVLFSFPAEPGVMLGIGDISLGYPICALVLVEQALFLPVIESAWGFAERHLPLADAAIRESDWVVSASSGPLTLVTGDTNYAHHAWNQLPAFDELSRLTLRDDIRVIATQQPLGPIHDILPDLPPWPVVSMPDTALQAQNETGRTFVPVGAYYIPIGLCRQIRDFAVSHLSEQAKPIDAALSATPGPVLWVSMRTRNRTAVNQHEMLQALAGRFLDMAPDGALVIDGYSVANDADSYPDYLRNESVEVLAADQRAAKALYDTVEQRYPGRTQLAVGLTVSDSIALARHASFYFGHHGTVQHKIGWFTDTPGVVHCNRAMLAARPGAWVAAQSEIARLPVYLEPDLVRDALETTGANAEYNHLLRHENYTIVNVPAVVEIVIREAGLAGLFNPPPSKDAPITPSLLRRLLSKLGLPPWLVRRLH